MSENDTSAPLPDIQPESTTAEYPFNDADPEVTDIIFLTSDGIQFYVNKAILAASPVFGAMFTLPPTPAQNESQVAGDRPCISVQDESKDFFQLLSWCDSRGTPLMTLGGFQAVLRPADKYGMETIIKRVEKTMELCDGLIKNESIKIYAIAIRYRFSNLAKLAARHSLALSYEQIMNFEGSELDQIPATALTNLFQYRFACGRAARASFHVNNRAWHGLASGWLEIQLFSNACKSCPDYGLYGISRPWFVEYMDQIDNVVPETPIGAKAVDQVLLSSTLDKMAKCGGDYTCKTQHNAFFKFLDSVTKRIEEATAEISIKLNF